MDIEKFFDKVNCPPLTIEEIKYKIPKVYQNIADVVLPQDTVNLLRHRPCDHKIKLLPGNYKFPHFRVRP